MTRAEKIEAAARAMLARMDEPMQIQPRLYEAQAARYYAAQGALRDALALPPDAQPRGEGARSHTVCIGWTTIRRVAAEGAVWFEDVGVGLVAADDLFHADIPQPAPPASGAPRECGHRHQRWACNLPPGHDCAHAYTPTTGGTEAIWVGDDEPASGAPRCANGHVLGKGPHFCDECGKP
jgi:hypothetical protein